MRCWKIAYKNAAKAKAVAHLAAENSPSGKLRPYRCPYCHKWHLTSQENKMKKDPKDRDEHDLRRIQAAEEKRKRRQENRIKRLLIRAETEEERN